MGLKNVAELAVIGSVLYFMLFCIVWFSLAFHTFYSLKTIKNVWEE